MISNCNSSLDVTLFHSECKSKCSHAHMLCISIYVNKYAHVWSFKFYHVYCVCIKSYIYISRSPNNKHPPMQSEDIHAKISNDDEMSPFAEQTWIFKFLLIPNPTTCFMRYWVTSSIVFPSWILLMRSRLISVVKCSYSEFPTRPSVPVNGKVQCWWPQEIGCIYPIYPN